MSFNKKSRGRRTLASLLALSMVAVGLVSLEQKVAPEAEAATTGWCNTAVQFYNSQMALTIWVPARGTSRSCLMSEGSNSFGVKALQVSLSKCIWRLNTGGVDGIFGAKTKSAVLTVQKSAKITQDGVYGPQTHNALLCWGTQLTSNNFVCTSDTRV